MSLTDFRSHLAFGEQEANRQNNEPLFGEPRRQSGAQDHPNQILGACVTTARSHSRSPPSARGAKTRLDAGADDGVDAGSPLQQPEQRQGDGPGDADGEAAGDVVIAKRCGAQAHAATVGQRASDGADDG